MYPPGGWSFSREVCHKHRNIRREIQRVRRPQKVVAAVSVHGAGLWLASPVQPCSKQLFSVQFSQFTDRADRGMRLVVCTAVNSMRRWQTSNAADSKPALCRSVTCPPRHLDKESKRTARSDRHPRAGRFGWESKAVEATARDHRVCEVLSVPGHDAASLRSFCFVSRREGGVSRPVS